MLSREPARTRNAVCICTDRNMLVPALFVAGSALSRLQASPNAYDVLLFAAPSEVTDVHRRWMRDRGIVLRDDMDMGRLEGVKQFSGRLTAATLMKLALAGHLAGEYDRLLYLDSDITIHDNVGAIFSLDTGPHEIAAVPSGHILADMTGPQRQHMHDIFKALGMTEPYRFFNSGVLYIDVAKWNRAGLEERSLAFIARNPVLCSLPDEHSLNAILDGAIAELTPIWNMRPLAGRPPAVYDIARPAIIHHMGPSKPWRRFGFRKRLFSDLSAYRLYEAFLADTPWPDWLREQWGARDVMTSIGWEAKRLSRRLRGKLHQTDEQLRAYLAEFRAHCAKDSFADLRQGIVERAGGTLRVREGAPAPALQAWSAARPT